MKLQFLFDVISPFAYMGFKQLHRLPESTEIELVPILFAALLDHYGQVGNAEIASKRRFTYRFALWRARTLGIPLQVPPAHPFNPVSALRLIIAAGSGQRAVETVFDAVWRDGRDVADPKVIAALARDLGIADEQTVIGDPAVKQQLRINTDAAIARGVFGVPTIVIGDEIFWGQDALDMALDYLRDPAGFNDAQMLKIDSLPVGVVRRRKETWRPAGS